MLTNEGRCRFGVDNDGGTRGRGEWSILRTERGTGECEIGRSWTDLAGVLSSTIDRLIVIGS